ncbi:MAG: acyl--CoA ligase [Chloroflexi bacterium]|nr:acyl--CoA ligase [Chloroflexota bacterium]MBP8058335.1 acyl--CoA ligase [Chloroflexota bacterium]
MILHSPERIEEYVANGWWGTTTLDTLFSELVRQKPDAAALSDPLNRPDFTDGAVRRYSFAELDTAVNRLAAAFLAYGLGKDDRIAVQLPNISELVIFYLACGRIGAIAVPFPVQYREYELENLSNFAEIRAFVTVTRLGDRHNAAVITDLRDKIASLETVMAFGANVPEGVVALDEALSSESEADWLVHYINNLRLTANDVFTICWTSGTESQPKGVPRTHNDWIAIAYATVDGAELTGDDVLLNPFPLVNMAGIGGMLVPWLLTGAKLVMHHPFDLMTFFKQIAIERISYTVAPPALLNMLLMREDMLAKADLSSLRVIGSGSAPLSPWMVKSWHDKFGIHVTNFFGANEGTALIGGPKDIPDPEKRAQYFPRFGVVGYEWSGRVPQGIQTRLVDLATDEEITNPRHPGELRLKGPTIFAGYWRGDEVGLQPFDEQGYFRTGDMFEIAGEGDDARYYRFVDRAKDIIIRGGVNIAAAEIEALILGHPKVADVAVVGFSDAILGEKACAFIVTKPEQTLTLDELVEFLKEKKIASYKLPERLEVVPGLPRNPVGKVLKRDLRQKL